MTAATVPAPPVAPAGSAAPPIATTPRRKRRWHRFAVPFGLLLALWLGTGVAHALQEPDLDEPGTLSPTGEGPDGSSRLAALLAEQGVTVRRATSSAEADRMLAGVEGPATVFVPTPELVDPRFLDELTRPGNRHRVVLAQPKWRSAGSTGLLPAGGRWATRIVAPDCDDELAVRAGRAGVHHSTYVSGDATAVCYGGALVRATSGRGELVAVGATDPFRNDRIDEVGNRVLATGLLAGHTEVIWVDVHRLERVKTARPPLPKFRYRQPDRSSGDGDDPLWAAFPPPLWAGLVLLTTLGALIAVVRARRLGPPVAEPLPVLVPATEIVSGRGRLYRRSRARGAALEALRTAALRRLDRVIGAGGEVDARIAARTGLPPEAVRAILYPAEPTGDAELAAAVARIDALVDATLGSPDTVPPGPDTVPPGPGAAPPGRTWTAENSGGTP